MKDRTPHSVRTSDDILITIWPAMSYLVNMSLIVWLLSRILALPFKPSLGTVLYDIALIAVCSSLPQAPACHFQCWWRDPATELFTSTTPCPVAWFKDTKAINSVSAVHSVVRAIFRFRAIMDVFRVQLYSNRQDSSPSRPRTTLQRGSSVDTLLQVKVQCLAHKETKQRLLHPTSRTGGKGLRILIFSITRTSWMEPMMDWLSQLTRRRKFCVEFPTAFLQMSIVSWLRWICSALPTSLLLFLVLCLMVLAERFSLYGTSALLVGVMSSRHFAKSNYHP